MVCDGGAHGDSQRWYGRRAGCPWKLTTQIGQGIQTDYPEQYIVALFTSSSPLVEHFLARRHHSPRLHTEYSKMAFWLATSRLSPFSSSLLSSTSPAQLPNLPTLAELQKHAEDVKSSVVDTVQPYLPGTDTVTPCVASTKRPPPAVAISRSVCQPVRPTGLGYTAPPPPYRSYEEGVMITEGTRGDCGVGGRDEVGRTLKKGRVGWKPLQSGIPEKDKVSAITKTEKSEGKTMGWWGWSVNAHFHQVIFRTDIQAVVSCGSSMSATLSPRSSAQSQEGKNGAYQTCMQWIERDACFYRCDDWHCDARPR